MLQHVLRTNVLSFSSQIIAEKSWEENELKLILETQKDIENLFHMDGSSGNLRENKEDRNINTEKLRLRNELKPWTTRRIIFWTFNAVPKKRRKIYNNEGMRH